jgi:hypothetical protein
LKPPQRMKESYQFDQVPPTRAALKMICTPGHCLSPPCSRFKKTPRSIVCIFDLMPIACNCETMRSPREK